MSCACHGVRLLSKGTFPGGQSVFPGVGDFFSSSLQCSWNPGGLNRIRAQSLWLSESHTYLSRCPKIKSVIWPRGSEFAWKEDNYEVSREGRMGSSPSLFSVIEGLDCSRTIHMDTVSSLCLSDVYLNIITNFAGLHFSLLLVCFIGTVTGLYSIKSLIIYLFFMLGGRCYSAMFVH